MVISATNQIAGNASHDYQYDDYTNSNQQYNYPPNYQHQISGESIQIVVNDVDIDPQQKYDSKYILREKNISPDLNWILSQMIALIRNLNKLVTVVVVEVPLQIQLQEKLPSITKKLQKVPLIMGMVYAWLDNWILILRLDESYGSTLEDQLMLEVLSTFWHVQCPTSKHSFQIAKIIHISGIRVGDKILEWDGLPLSTVPIEDIPEFVETFVNSTVTVLLQRYEICEFSMNIFFVKSTHSV